MNSVFLGPAERETTVLEFEGGIPPLTVAELLGWVERFATEEGLRLMREGGKDGIIHAFLPTIEKLHDLVSAATDISQNNSGNPTRAFHTPRVQRALEELENQLQVTFDLAKQVKRSQPTVMLVDPDQVDVYGDKGVEVRLTVEGEDFQKDATVALFRQPANSSEILIRPSGNPIVVGTTAIWATFDLEDANVGTWSVRVTNPDGGKGELLEAFTIYDSGRQAVLAPPQEPPPTLPIVRRFSPQHGPRNSAVTLTIRGEHFPPNPEVILRRDTDEIEGTVVDVKDTTVITATFDLSDKQADTEWAVVVLTPDGRPGEGATLFTIEEPPPLTVHRFTPLRGTNTGSVTLRITGAHFPPDPEVILRRGTDEIEGTVDKVDGTKVITATFNLIDQLPDTEWDVVVTPLDGSSAQGDKPFKITGSSPPRQG
jgi:hypothetical protein